MDSNDCVMHGYTPGSAAWGARADQVIAEIRAKVRDPAIGWFGLGIGEDPENQVAGFNYTIGLEENWGQTEVFVMGLPYEAGHGILWRVVDLVRQGRRFKAGDESEDIAHGYPARFKAPLVDWVIHFGVSRRYYGRDVQYLQLVWPDRDGIFPGEPGMDPDMERIQAVG